ncbi:sodium:phosphate symporter activity [Nesidiocoris tenuis]|uniref:Sodium:phosphate symporter activity n=1 Tax=Nesidiocoris tenuis TaxID=355587 RepID=A0ABN7BF99_9HEMI|nr:sodium:phosphate symporter activity [Nesidiocoris tenuis]
METPVEQREGWVRQRYVIGLLGFFALANGYIQRFCLSLAITEMVATHRLHPSKIDLHACPLDTVITTNGTVHRASGEFVWDEATQGLILSAFFWGYVVMHVPGGLMAERFGAKTVLGFGMLTSTLATLATPIVARTGGAIALIILRFVLGLGQGPLYPSLNVLLAHWAPTHERGRLGAIVFAGAQIGNVVSMALSGFLISYGGWTTVFYTFGFLGLAWAVLWKFLVYSTPSQNPVISNAEKQYILQTAGRSKQEDLPPTPWRSILTSVPLWGLIIAQIGHDWGLFTIVTDLPKYMKSVMHFSITQNGLLSAAPYIVMWIVAIISGWIVDWLVGPRGVNITIVRKIFVTIASIGPAIGILSASYAGCDKVLVSLFFASGMGLMGAFVPSLKVNALDLSPNYAGTLMALVGGIGAISGMLTPSLVGFLTPNSTMLEWRLVFWISVIVLMSTNVVYLIFGSAKVQPWNEQSPVVESKKNVDSVDKSTLAT